MEDWRPVVEITPVTDLSALAPEWLDLESRADGSFFQSWAWTGCLAEERFAEPWLLSARRGEKIVALALFSRGPRRRPWSGRPILLGESGDIRKDSIFIEHNGLLLDRDEPAELGACCWRGLENAGFRSAIWIVSGLPRAACGALPSGRGVRVTARRPAPYFDFSALASADFSATGSAEATMLDHLSANTRQQIRRSLRAWGTIGPLTLTVAGTPEEARAFLEGLKVLHQRYWTGRGKPGAFAEPFFERFHASLIGRAANGQSVDLIRVSAGDRIVGYLYNLVHHAWVAAYQSGFDFSADSDRLRPGLVCHALAIQHYRRAGMRLYDFLGGEARYKRSFSNAERELLWLKTRPRSPWQVTHRMVARPSAAA